MHKLQMITNRITSLVPTHAQHYPLSFPAVFLGFSATFHLWCKNWMEHFVSHIFHSMNAVFHLREPSFHIQRYLWRRFILYAVVSVGVVAVIVHRSELMAKTNSSIFREQQNSSEHQIWKMIVCVNWLKENIIHYEHTNQPACKDAFLQKANRENSEPESIQTCARVPLAMARQYPIRISVFSPSTA